MAGRIFVDADACPVKTEIVHTAASFGVEVVMVASVDHQLQPIPGVLVVQVDRSAQSVDLYIANKLQKGDVLITQDFGLAALGLAKQAIVISNRGLIYSDAMIDNLLHHRHIHAKLRRGGMRVKGPRALTDEDRGRFLQTLTKVLQNLQENLSP